jgi:BirA family biotin operon repressor/biotin-[acetyl-CoA-carboxylase] ligase
MPLDIRRIRERLPGRDVVWFDTVGSTMTEAEFLAAQGCASGTLVLAEEQTAGHGRYGRDWHSERESGLYCSVVLRPALPPDSLPALTLALGLAAADAIQRAAGLACDLRWPNDVLIEGRKCAGILTQLADGAVIAGIGINVNHERMPEELAGIATSLRIRSGRMHSREDLLVALAESIDAFSRILAEDGKEQILRLFSQASSYVTGRRVKVDQDGATLTGVTDGLDPSGFLVLRRDDGTRSLILAGGVRPYAAGA